MDYDWDRDDHRLNCTENHLIQMHSLARFLNRSRGTGTSFCSYPQQSLTRNSGADFHEAEDSSAGILAKTPPICHQGPRGIPPRASGPVKFMSFYQDPTRNFGTDPHGADDWPAIKFRAATIHGQCD
jgi:hypothetical protein